ncbi:MAG: hypothetical protein AAGF59_04795 [Pseudomonadota bacterium]
MSVDKAGGGRETVPDAHSPTIDPSSVQNALERILASRPFAGSPQLAVFLTHVVEETLADRAETLKAYTIAVDALKRSADFDPQTDPLVRVLAGRVRSALAAYYRDEGHSDPVEIAIPKGSYKPLFHKRPLQPGTESAPNVGDAPVPSTAADDAEVGRQEKQIKRLVRMVLVLATILVLLATYILIHLYHDRQRSQTTGRFEGPRLLIQPFRAPPQSGWGQIAEDLAIGLSAELVVDMSQYPWLSVIQLPASADPISQMVRDYHVENAPDYVLTGHVATVRENVLISATLLEFPTLAVKWSANYSEPLEAAKIDAVQSRLSQSIAEIVGSQGGVMTDLILSEPQRELAVDFEAFRCFLGIYDFLSRPSDERHLQLRTCLTQAVDRNPDYAEAWAALGYIGIEEGINGRNARPGSDPWREADEAIERALALAPLSSVVLNVAMTLAVERPDPDFEAFTQYGRKDLALRPNNPFTLANFGLRLAANTGAWEEGLAYYERALALNPDPPGWYFYVPAYYAVLRRDDQAVYRAASRLPSLQSANAGILKAIGAYRSGRLSRLSDHIEGLAELDIGSVADAHRYIENRRYEPTLKEALKRQISRAFDAYGRASSDEQS